MKVIKNIDIWPGRNNGLLVEKTDSNGKLYEAHIYKEEYELEMFLLNLEKSIDNKKITELRELIQKYGSMMVYDKINSDIRDI